MPMTRTPAATAADKKRGMTLDELASFIQDAMKQGASGGELVEVTTVGLIHPRIKTAKVTISGEGADR